IGTIDRIGEDAITCVIPAHDVGARVEIIHELLPLALAGHGCLLDAVDVESRDILVGDGPGLPPEAEGSRTDESGFHPGRATAGFEGSIAGSLRAVVGVG